MSGTPAVELAVQDVTGVRVAVALGVDRVELCSALGLGGVTPSVGVVEAAVAAAQGVVGVHVLVRPRPGDFEYDRDELDVTLRDVRRALDAGAAGVVVGALTEAGALDVGYVRTVVELAQGREVTIHRAVDVSADPAAAVLAAAESGATRVLTSGGAPSATEGTATLARMVSLVGDRLQVMAGGGITPDTVPAVLASGVHAVHFSARRAVASRGIPLGARDDGSHDVTDPDLARRTVAAVRHWRADTLRG